MKLQKARFYLKSKVVYPMEGDHTIGYRNSGAKYVVDCLDRLLKREHRAHEIFIDSDEKFFIRLETKDSSDERYLYSTTFVLFIGFKGYEVCFGDYTLYTSHADSCIATEDGIKHAIEIFEEANHV